LKGERKSWGYDRAKIYKFWLLQAITMVAQPQEQGEKREGISRGKKE